MNERVDKYQKLVKVHFTKGSSKYFASEYIWLINKAFPSSKKPKENFVLGEGCREKEKIESCVNDKFVWRDLSWNFSDSICRLARPNFIFRAILIIRCWIFHPVIYTKLRS